MAELVTALSSFIGRAIPLIQETSNRVHLLKILEERTTESAQILPYMTSEIGDLQKKNESLKRRIDHQVAMLKKEAMSIQLVQHCLYNNPVLGTLRDVMKLGRISSGLRERHNKFHIGMENLSRMVLIHLISNQMGPEKVRVLTNDRDEDSETVSSHQGVIPSSKEITDKLETIRTKKVSRKGIMKQLATLVSDNDAATRIIVECEGTGVMCHILKNENDQAISHLAITLLSSLTVHLFDNNEKDKVLVALLDFMKKSLDMPLDCLTILSQTLSLSDKGPDSSTRQGSTVLHHDGLRTILRTLNYHTADAAVQGQGLFVLALLSKRHRGIRVQMGTPTTKGGLDAIQRAMQIHTSSQVVQRSGCAALHSVCHGEPANCREAFRQGLRNNVLQAMDVFPSCGVIYRFGILFLHEISVNHLWDGDVTLPRSKGVRLLVNSLTLSIQRDMSGLEDIGDCSEIVKKNVAILEVVIGSGLGLPAAVEGEVTRTLKCLGSSAGDEESQQSCQMELADRLQSIFRHLR